MFIILHDISKSFSKLSVWTYKRICDNFHVWHICVKLIFFFEHSYAAYASVIFDRNGFLSGMKFQKLF